MTAGKILSKDNTQVLKKSFLNSLLIVWDLSPVDVIYKFGRFEKSYLFR